jgi:DNA-binding winged helix-turn-helix (wHTH) protein
MQSKHPLVFTPFRLDLIGEQLWRGAERVPLRPKALALLHYLVEHPQRLITQEELLDAIWRRTYVSDGLLRGYIRERGNSHACRANSAPC